MFSNEQLISEIKLRLRSIDHRIEELSSMLKNYSMKNDSHNFEKTKRSLKYFEKTSKKTKVSLLHWLEIALNGTPTLFIKLPLQRSYIEGVEFYNDPLNPKSYNYTPPPRYYVRQLEPVSTVSDSGTVFYNLKVLGPYTHLSYALKAGGNKVPKKVSYQGIISPEQYASSIYKFP